MSDAHPSARLHAIIPAGGAGTRLWPLSRRSHPKFLLDLTGAGHTLLQGTVARLEPLAESITIVTGAAHRDAVAQQVPQVGGENILVEPSPRDSMAAIGLAAAVVAQRVGPDAVVGSFAADHVITDHEAFACAVTQAIEVAKRGWVVTIGIHPTSPSTAFGYICAGAALGISEAPDAQAAVDFTEKPDAATAADYLASGSYRWNAGMFVATAGVLLEHLSHHHPDLAAGLADIAAAWDTAERDRVLSQRWPELEKIAIDHAIAEPVAAEGGVAVVPADMGWDDVGGFDALASVIVPASDPRADGVAILDARGAGHGSLNVEGYDSAGTLVASTSGRVVRLLGVPDLVVVDTPTVLLVTTADRAQDVKGLVDRLAADSRTDLL